MNITTRNSLQFLLFFMLGLSSWFVVSAIFSEIPLLVQLLLEAEAVGSTLDLCVNVGNIVPLLLVMFQRKTGKSGDALVIFLSCITNIAVSFAMIFMFPTSSPSSRSSSLSLIIITTLAGIVGNTSMVTLFPYVRPFGPAAIAALSSGIGACGLAAQLLSTAQSVGRTRVAGDGTLHPDPAFSLQAMFACVCACSFLSLSCFVIIHKRIFFLRGEGWVHGSVGAEQPAAGVAHLLRIERDEIHDPTSGSDASVSAGTYGTDHANAEKMTLSDSEDSSIQVSGSSGAGGGRSDGGRSINPMVLLQSLAASERWVCFVLACSCFLNFVLPGLMPFMCGSAGDRFTIMQWLYFVYFLGSVLGRAAVTFRPFRRIGALTVCSGVAWLMLTARVFLWPTQSSPFVTGVVMLCVLVCSVSNGVVSTMAFCMVSSESATKILGLFNQAGALCGAMFAIITVRALLI